MSKGRSVREHLDVYALARTPAALPALNVPLTQHLMALDSRVAPLSALLERGSDWSFLDGLVHEVVSYGIDWPEAEAVVAAVLGQPSLVMVSRTSRQRVVEVLMAVALQPPASGDVNLVVAGAEVEAGKPPVVHGSRVELESFDLSSPSGIAGLAQIIEVEQRRMGASRTTAKAVGGVNSLVWLGNPLRHGYYDAPPSWEEEVRSAGIVHGIDIKIVETVEALKAQSLLDGTDGLLVLPGVELPSWRDGQSDWHPIDFARPGSGFTGLMAHLRTTLVEIRDRASVSMHTGKRTLSPGERVYHRKIGSGGPTDRFDQGSPDACPHGADNYVRFHKAPKAVKGMQRIYTNVGPNDLYHCNKFPNCGVYMVQGPS